MSDETPFDISLPKALETLAAVETAGSVEDVLHRAVEAACAVTASPRGLAGLFDGEAVVAAEWFDADEGWTGTPLRWELGEGAPGRVCESGTPLACNDLPGTAACLPEATGPLRLQRFACVPLAEQPEDHIGFLEVGNRPADYTVDEVRSLSVIARRAAARLHAMAAAERRAAERHLLSEALVGGRGLFSLDPEVVLEEAATRAREISGAADVVALRLESPRQIESAGLEEHEHAALDEAARTRAPAAAGARVLALPLSCGDRLLAGVVLRDAPAPLDDARREALDTLAARAGVALEHALLYTTQRTIARRLQERLLPLAPPELPGLDVAVAYRSASHGAGRGGDFVDFYSQTASHLALAIGDVAGKGVDALATTVLVKHVLRAVVAGGTLSWPVRPGGALQALHNGLLGELDAERFVTVLVALLNVRGGTLQLATAGHPAPFVLRATGVERPLLLTAPAMGIDLEAALTEYPAESVALDRGDTVVFFTDGVAELRGRDGSFFEDAMPAALAPLRGRAAADVVTALLDAAAAFAAQPPADDMALVCLRLTSPAGGDTPDHETPPARQDLAGDAGTGEA